MPLAAPAPTRTRWVNILPVVFVMYTISYFDRTNIGIALPYIMNDIHINPAEAGLMAGVFYWGYAVTQLLAGWLTLKLGSRNLVGAALWLWGVAAIGTAMVQNVHELIAARLLLGLVEGPIFAATAAFLAEWFQKKERGRAFGLWNLSSPFGAFLAGPISGLILAHYDWRLMMVIEGLPAWIWAVLWYWRIPASVDKARWLPAAERDALKAALKEEQAELKNKSTTPSDKWWTIFSEPSVWLTMIGATLIMQLITGYQVWLPSVFKGMGGLSIQVVGILSGLPFLAGMAGIWLITEHSDRHGQERRWHAAVPTFITGVLLIAAMALPPPLMVLQIVLLVVAGFTMKMFLPLIFTSLTETLPRTKAVAAVTFVNAVANLLAGTTGPLLIGILRQRTQGFDAAFMALGAGALLGGIFFACVGARWTGWGHPARTVEQHG